MKVEAEVVNGKCPTCNQFTMLVGLTPELFRCMNCGSDLQQHVNGKITYLPVMTARDDGGVPFVKEWLEQWLDKVLSFLHLEINPRNVDHGNIKKIKINKKNVKNHRKDTKARVDKRPLISYIERMKGRNMKTVTINVSGASQSQWSTFLLELNLMKKAWKRYGVDAELKAKSLTKIINLGTTYGEANRRLRQDSKRVQQNKR